jgi:hypothetical protein
MKIVCTLWFTIYIYIIDAYMRAVRPDSINAYIVKNGALRIVLFYRFIKLHRVTQLFKPTYMYNVS